jgi:ketosteroid isomerase-like protein
MARSSAQPNLPRPVAAMIDATNNEDREALVRAFAEDAVLVDLGRTFSGRASIAQWNDDENIGTHNHIRVTSVSHEGSTTTVGTVVTGSGYNGSGTFVFELRGDQILRLTCAGLRRSIEGRALSNTAANRPAGIALERMSARRRRLACTLYTFSPRIITGALESKAYGKQARPRTARWYADQHNSFKGEAVTA